MVHCGYEPTASARPRGAARRHLEEHQVQLRREAQAARRGRETSQAFNGVSAGNGHLTGKEQCADRLIRNRPPRSVMQSPSTSSRRMRQPQFCHARNRSDAVIASRRPRSSNAIRRAQQNLLRLQHAGRATGCGELFVDSTLCSDYVLYMHWAGEVDPVLAGKMRRAHPPPPARRRRLEYLRRRPERGERVGEGLLRAQARRPLADAPWMREARAHDPAPRRHPADEHLREALPRAARAVSVEISADDPGRRCSSSRAGSSSTSTRCRRGAGRCSCRSRSSITSSRRAQLPAEKHCTSSIRSAPSRPISRCDERAPVHVAEFFPPLRSRAEVATTGFRCQPAAPARARGSRAAG